MSGIDSGHLGYLSQVSRQLGVTDPVEQYYAPIVGKWDALHDEATRWRAAARTAGEVTDALNKTLGGLDASWQGKDADSFVAYVQSFGLSGHDLSDAMTAMADALDQTASGVRKLVGQLGDILSDSADSVSEAMSVPVHGEKRARDHLDGQSGPARELFESVRDVLEAFARLCDGTSSGGAFAKIAVKHAVSTQNWSYDYSPPPAASAPGTHIPSSTSVAAPPASSQPAGAAAPATHLGGGGVAVPAAASAGAPDSAQQLSQGTMSGVLQQPAGDVASTAHASSAGAASAAAGQSGGGMAGSMMGGGGQGGKGGGDQEHKAKIRLSGDLKDLLGAPEKTTPPVIGEN